MQERIRWADQVRGLGILLAFSIHFFAGEFGRKNMPVQLMTLTVLTVFCFSSGYFFKGRFEFRKWLVHHTGTLLLPYLVASLIFWVLHFLQGDPDSLNRFLGIFLQLPETPWEGGRWFVPSFFVAKLVFDFTASRMGNRIPTLLMCAFGYAGVAWIYTLLGGPRFPWNVEAAFFMQPFFAMGYAWKNGAEQRYIAFAPGRKRALLLGSAVGFVALAWVNLQLGGRTIDYHSRILNEFFTAYGASACSMFLVLQLCRRGNWLLGMIGRNSLVFNLYTGLAGAVTSRIEAKLGLVHWSGRFLLGITVQILMIGLMAMVMNRFFPWSVGRKRSKGRTILQK